MIALSGIVFVFVLVVVFYNETNKVSCVFNV